uniref:C2H2-type domain-containing protein n=1 Tax=Globodera pallida TaxID=36090 RepID=A0A183BQD0_GLOPA
MQFGASGFCDQIFKIFNENDNKEADGELCCSSSLFPSDDQQLNMADEEIQSPLLRSIVDDLLTQQPAQLDVLVSAAKNKKQNPQAVVDGVGEATTIESRRPVADENELRPQSEPSLLIRAASSFCARPASVGTFQQPSFLIGKVADEIVCEDDIVEIAAEKGPESQTMRSHHCSICKMPICGDSVEQGFDAHVVCFNCKNKGPEITANNQSVAAGDGEEDEDEPQLHDVDDDILTDRKRHRNNDATKKLEAIRWARRNSIKSAAKKFGVDRKSIQVWIKQEDKLKQQMNSGEGTRKRLNGGGRPVQHLDTDIPSHLVKFYPVEKAASGRASSKADLMANGQPVADQSNRQNCPQSHQSDENIAERCAFDPVTKRRFYEPHKRHGCAGEYCLSQVTQIGERICSVENKLARLSELFRQLLQNGKTGDDATEKGKQKQRQQISSSSASRPQQRLQDYVIRPPANALMAQRVRPLPTNIRGFRQPSPCINRQLFHTFRLFSIRRPILTIKFFVQPFINRIDRLGIGSNRKLWVEKYSPENGMKGAVENGSVCPVCFAKFEPFVNLSIHVLRHMDKKLPVDFIRCKLCFAQNSVHFLSVPAVREHIRTAHGVTKSDAIREIAVSDPKGAHPMVQTVLKRFARLRMVMWESHSQIKTKLALLVKQQQCPNSSSRKRRRNREEGEEDVVDQLLFASTGVPQSLSERFQRLRKDEQTGATTTAMFGNSTGANGSETLRRFCYDKISAVRFLHDQSECTGRFVSGTWNSPAGSGGNITLWSVQQPSQHNQENNDRIVKNGRIELGNCDVSDIYVVNAQQCVVSTTTGDVRIVDCPLEPADGGGHSADGTTKMSTMAKYSRVHKYSASTALCVLNDEIFSGSDSGQIVRIQPDNHTSHATRLFAQDLMGVTSLAACGPSHLVSAHRTGQLHLWDVRNWPSTAMCADFGGPQPTLSRSVTALNNAVTALATHPAQHNVIAFGSQDGVVSFVDIRQTNRPLPIAFKVSRHPINRIKFHPIFANNLFSSSDAGLIHWDASALAYEVK